jgi:hypothetical protein
LSRREATTSLKDCTLLYKLYYISAKDRLYFIGIYGCEDKKVGYAYCLDDGHEVTVHAPKNTHNETIVKRITSLLE